MKDHVEIGHLAESDAFRVNRDQVMELEIWFWELQIPFREYFMPSPMRKIA